MSLMVVMGARPILVGQINVVRFVIMMVGGFSLEFFVGRGRAVVAAASADLADAFLIVFVSSTHGWGLESGMGINKLYFVYFIKTKN